MCQSVVMGLIYKPLPQEGRLQSESGFFGFCLPASHGMQAAHLPTSAYIHTLQCPSTNGLASWRLYPSLKLILIQDLQEQNQQVLHIFRTAEWGRGNALDWDQHASHTSPLPLPWCLMGPVGCNVRKVEQGTSP